MTVALTTIFSSLSALYLLACARREWRTRGELSARTSAGVWALALAYTALIVFTAWRYGGHVPVSRAAAYIIGGALLVGGGLLYGAGVIAFRSFGQVSGTKTGGLVTGGVYRRSRNPQVTGWLLVLSGAAVAGRSPAALALATLFFAFWHAAVKAEEEHLRRTFGEGYERYRSSVPRYFGRKA